MEASSVKCVLFAIVALALLTSAASADFYMRSLSVFININRDGSANVEERVTMAINSTQSRDLYDITRSAYSDLATWKDRTGLSEMRHHISRASAEITDIRVLPQAVDFCNSFLGICQASVLIDYRVSASENGSGLVSMAHYKPRTANYSLQQNSLSFEQTKTGDIILPPNTNITISIPQSAQKIYFSTVPANLANEADNFRFDQSANVRYYSGQKRIFTWQGDTLSNFQFTYEIESPLESEVLDFFHASEQAVIILFMGQEGFAAFIIISAIAASIYYFNKLNK
ncbi:MAG: hypothetical protein NTV88_01870 [Candidatus Micrarchaeota archaeon]|nr:hypothetical protein [Candidatus Micrarchaeota archaeon]